MGVIKVCIYSLGECIRMERFFESETVSDVIKFVTERGFRGPVQIYSGKIIGDQRNLQNYHYITDHSLTLGEFERIDDDDTLRFTITTKVVVVAMRNDASWRTYDCLGDQTVQDVVNTISKDIGHENFVMCDQLDDFITDYSAYLSWFYQQKLVFHVKERNDPLHITISYRGVQLLATDQLNWLDGLKELNKVIADKIGHESFMSVNEPFGLSPKFLGNYDSSKWTILLSAEMEQLANDSLLSIVETKPL